MKIVADQDIPFVTNYFANVGELILKKGRQLSNQDIKDADLLLIRSVTPVNAELLANTQVKCVASVSTGKDHLDLDWLKAANIAVVGAFGFNAFGVVDYVMSVIAALKKEFSFPLPSKVAVIGVGRIGQLVVKNLQTLGINPILCDPLRAMQERDFLSTNLDEIADVDLITLHVPLTQSPKLFPTYHFLNQQFFERQKKGTVLLNTSRGAVIESQSLLQFGKHLHWCFDVFEGEPCINKEIVQQSLIATPHIAGHSIQSKLRGTHKIYQELCDRHLIKPQTVKVPEMPEQTFKFTNKHLSWEDIVLGIYNPLLTSAIMKQQLLNEKFANQDGKLFDSMRREFKNRYEFAYAKVKDIHVSEHDTQILEQLGIKIIH